MSNTSDSAALCNQKHELTVNLAEIHLHQKQVLSVFALTCITMLVEIVVGHLTGSMALQADGYHMASHAGALGVAFLAYRAMSWERLRSRMNFGSGKILALGGYSSAVALGFVALWMIVESVGRLLSPKSIRYDEALLVAVLGLGVNVASAVLLGWGKGSGHHHLHHHTQELSPQHKHGHEHGHELSDGAFRHGRDQQLHLSRAAFTDHNHQAALVHVLADALTSVLAIVALLVARDFPSAVWLDPAMGVVGAALILRWAWSLLKQTAAELLDFYPSGVSLQTLKGRIEHDGHHVWDLHLWSQGKGALVATLSVTPAHPETDFKKYFAEYGRSLHLSVEKVLPVHTPH